jgi:iron(III) transport system permease protein
MSVVDSAPVVAPARPRPRLALGRVDLRRLILPAAVSAVLLWLVLPPLIFIVQTSLTTNQGDALTLDHYAAIFSSLRGAVSLLGDSLIFAVGSDIVAIGLGTLLAWLTERTDVPFKGTAYIGAFLSFAVPPIVKVIGWILLFGPKAGFINVWLSQLLHIPRGTLNVFSMGGMIAIEGLLWTPVVFLLMTVPFRSLDPSLEEAASTSGAGALQAFRRVTLPLALPSVLAVLLLTAARSLSAFEVPALIGIPAGVHILTTRIYLLTTQGFIPHYGDSSAYGVILMLLVGLALYPYYLATRQTQKFATVTGKGFRPRMFRLGRWRLLAAVLMLLLPLLVVLPTLALLWASVLPYVQQPAAKALGLVTLRNYSHAFSDSHIVAATINSVVVGVASATGGMFITMLTAWLVVRGRSRGRWLLDQLTTVPLMIPGIVLGIALLRTYLTLPLPLYGTVWILVIAYVTAALPFAMRFCYSGVLTISRELEESAQVSGAAWWTTMRRIVLPLMMPALFAGWIGIFMVTFRELTVSLLLVTPSSQVIPVTIWDLWENGSVSELSAFTVALSIALIALGLVLRRMSQRYGYRVV